LLFTHAGEYVVPKGTQVGMLIAALHQDPEQFPDPEKFNPNRFDQLNSELSQQSSDHSVQDQETV